MSAIAITKAMNMIVNGFFDLAMTEDVRESLDLDSETVEKLLKLWQDKKDDIDAEMKSQVEEILPKKAKRVKKPKDAPKNPRSAYILFCNDERVNVKKDMAELNAKEVLKELGRRWKEEDDSTKTKYQDLANNDKKRYEEEMANYVPSEEPETKEKKKRAKKAKDAPKNALSAYNFFCKDEREKVKEKMPNSNAKEIMAELGKRWKDIKDTDAADKYKKMAEEDKKRYAEEMETYVPSEEGEKTKKPRAKKPKDAPKNPRSAYMFYCEKNRESLKKKNSELKGKEITTKLADEWKKIKDTKKADKYKKMAEEDKQRHAKEMEEYKERKHIEEDDKESDEDDSEDEVYEQPKETLESVIAEIIDKAEGKELTKKYIKNQLADRNIEFTKEEFEAALKKAQA